MKFTWFNLMPWPYLPEDFRQKYRSVWVDIPNRLYDPVRGNALYHEYMDQLMNHERWLETRRGVLSLREFFIGNARRLGTAGKILFPIPNRRLSKRLYRLTTDTLVVWAENDRLMPPVYAAQWQALLPTSHTVCLAGAGHMLPYEQPQALAREVLAFLA
jgi:pimeloyl-ACP methyl ester carboxylesterase